MDGAALEAESLGLADDHIVRCALEIVDASSLFAREIAAASSKR